MKALYTLLFFLITCFTSVYAQEQLLRSIKDAGKKKIEQQDFNTTRNNKERGNLQNEKKQSAPAPGSTPEPVSSESDTSTVVTPEVDESESAPVTNDPASAYTFDSKLTYQMESGKKQDKTTVSYYYADGSLMTQLQGKDASTIMDMEKELMITIDEAKKTAFVMSSAMMTKMIANQALKAEEKAPVTVVRTGQKKTILGYSCEEVLITSEDSKTISWVTTEIKMDYSKTFGIMAMSMNKNMPKNGLDNQGVMMEMFNYNKKGELDSHMLMTEYKKETVVKTMSAYAVTKM